VSDSGPVDDKKGTEGKASGGKPGGGDSVDRTVCDGERLAGPVRSRGMEKETPPLSCLSKVKTLT